MKMSLYSAIEVVEQLDVVTKYTGSVDEVTALTVSWIDCLFTPVRLLRDTYSRSNAEHKVFIDLGVSPEHLIILRQVYEKAEDQLDRASPDKQDRS